MSLHVYSRCVTGMPQRLQSHAQPQQPIRAVCWNTLDSKCQAHIHTRCPVFLKVILIAKRCTEASA